MFGLFFIEVHVSKLILNKDTYRDSGGATLVVRVNFIHFPAMEIVEYNRLSKNDSFFFEFKAGEAMHFSMQPEELLSKMKKMPLRIGVFRKGDQFPICQTCTNFSGCACDLASMSIDDSTPFTFKGPFDLLDPGNNFAGHVGVDVSVTSMGRRVVTHYALAPGYFVFKNEPEGAEYKCSFKDVSSAEPSDGGYRSFVRGDNLANTLDPAMRLDSILTENLMRDIVGISPAAERLAHGRPPPKPPRPPLEDPVIISEASKKPLAQKKKKKRESKKRP